jgi:hypothetical protein
MRWLKIAGDQLLGMFVSDWRQTLGILAILALGWLAISRLHAAVLPFGLAAVLAAHLVYTAVGEARRRAAG